MDGSLLAALVGATLCGSLSRLWAPVGVLCAVQLPLLFLFRLPVRIAPSHGALADDGLWLGLGARPEGDWIAVFGQMLATLGPRLVLLGLAVRQRNCAAAVAAAAAAAAGRAPYPERASVADVAVAALEMARSPLLRLRHSLALAALPAPYAGISGNLGQSRAISVDPG